MVLASLKRDAAQPYHQQLVVAFREPINSAAFVRTVEICFARHAGLMARFEFRGGELFQSQILAAKIATKELDLSGESGTRDERLNNFLAADAAAPLPIGTDEPAWRSTALKLGPNDLVWVWSHHHALCDGSSYPLLLRELFSLYDAMVTVQEPERNAASPDFLDHLAWLEKQDWTAQEKEWRDRFSPEDAPTRLPKIRGRLSPIFSDAETNFKRVAVKIEPELQARLPSLCAETGQTPNTLLLAAWALWLARAQNEKVVIFGAMRAARKSSIANADSVMGAFANTLPVRIDVPENVSVRDWLRNVRQEWQELRSLEQCSLAQIAEWTGLELGAAGLPAVVNFQRARLQAQLREIGLTPARCEAKLIQSTDVPLTLNGYEFPQLEAELVWQSEMVDDATAISAAAGVSAMLRAIADDPNQRLGSIEILMEEDRHVLEMTDGPRFPLDATALAHDKIDDRIAEQPDSIAFRGKRREITYRELGDAAERIRVFLDAIGGSEDVVALILPPGPEIACAMLGVLRAGRAFFVINPSSPPEERAAMLRRVEVVAAIVADGLVEESVTMLRDVFAYETIVETKVLADSVRTRPQIKPTDLAYVVHTSGSTGDKKFVEIAHRSLANALDQLTELFDIGPNDRRIARASPGADYFISEILVTLSAGATLVFPERHGPMSLGDFLKEIREQQITVTGIPASFWHEWVRAMDEDGGHAIPPHLKLVISGMEKINPQTLGKWRRIVGDKVRWLNVYGPAETTLIATAYEAGSESGDDASNVPIGKALGNTQAYVLDHGQRRLPVGVTGEICVAGLGVARGYRGNVKATRAKFVPNPHDHSAEFSRLYRTGDYGYIDERGLLVFLGRRDFQIKIRGHRIELGEIAAALERHENVRQAVVTVHSDENDQWLVAHLTTNRANSESAIREWLRRQLAPPFQPANFIIRDEMPLLPSGKIDRAQLAADYSSQLISWPKTTNAPTPIKATLQTLWRETLGKRAGLNGTDNFFDVGGDSLSAVRLLCRIEEEFEVDLSIHDLFTNPTIDSLSRLLESDSTETNYTSLVLLNSGSSGTPLFIAHGWSGAVFHSVGFARRLSRPVYGLNAVELAGRERHQTFEEMARHYADEVIRRCPVGPIDLLGHSVGGIVAYATACELIGRDREVGTLFIVDALPSNLPRHVYLRFLAPYFRKRLPLHAKTLLRTGPRFWPRYLRGRRRTLRSLLMKQRAFVNSSSKPPPNSDYYYLLGTKFVPRRVRMNVCLLTPDSQPVAVFWKYLTRNPVQIIPLRSEHIDMFDPANLENFLAAFQQATTGKQSRFEALGARATRQRFDYLKT
jgi:amino acid adenylation domain-containing protein